jgi:replicative DNA helicase
MNMEEELIGALLTDNSKFVEVREIVSKKDFEEFMNAVIFEAIESFDGKCDINIIGNDLVKKGHKNFNSKLSEMIIKATASHAIYYAEAVLEASRVRQAKIIGAGMAKDNTGKSLDQILTTAENSILNLALKKHIGFRDAREMSFDYLERQIKKKNNKTEISGMPTGHKVLDGVLDGIRDGELIIIGARVSQGKTSFMLNILNYASCVCGKRSALFSIESSEAEIYHKLVSIKSKISTSNLRNMTIDDYEHNRMMVAIDEIGQAKININDISNVNILSIRAGIKRLDNMGMRPDIVFVDYLQIVDVSQDETRDTYAKKIGRVAQGLKNLAKEMNIPVVACAQVNRNAQSDHPKLYDLKDSGDIEQISDVVMFLHRPEFYYKGTEPIKAELKGLCLVDVAKNRNGNGVSVINFNFEAYCTRFTER